MQNEDTYKVIGLSYQDHRKQCEKTAEEIAMKELTLSLYIARA